MQFVKREFDAFRKDFGAAAAELGKKYNLDIQLGNIRYTDTAFTSTLTCTKTDAGDLAEQEFKQYCSMFGLTPEDYKREFTCHGNRYRLVGFALKRHKYPMKCIRLDNGKQYFLVEEDVKNALKK